MKKILLVSDSDELHKKVQGVFPDYLVLKAKAFTAINTSAQGDDTPSLILVHIFSKDSWQTFEFVNTTCANIPQFCILSNDYAEEADPTELTAKYGLTAVFTETNLDPLRTIALAAEVSPQHNNANPKEMLALNLTHLHNELARLNAELHITMNRTLPQQEIGESTIWNLQATLSDLKKINIRP